MPLNKVHKRKLAGNLPRQLLGGTTTTTHATSATSAVHSVQNPTGPPLFISTTSSGAGAGATTTSSLSGGTTDTSAATGTTTTTANTVVATSAVGGGAAQVTSAPVTSGAHTSASRTVTRAVTASTSSTASPTSTGTGDDGMSLGSIAGAAAAAVLGIGIIAAFFVWFIRRKKKNSDPDEEPFNRNSFLRQSVIIPDDGPVPTRNRATPAPSMVERQPTYGATQTFDAGQSAFGYNTQPSYGAGQLYAPNAMNPFGPGGAPATPLPPSPGFGTAYEQPGYNNGGYSELTRGSMVQDFPPSPHGNGPMSPPLENPHSPNYPGPETFPAPSHETIPSHDDHPGMYAQPGFPELTPATVAAQQGQVVAVSSSVHDGRETPVQLGFAPVQMPNANQASQANQTNGNSQKGGKRETMYNDDDAYGGI